MSDKRSIPWCMPKGIRNTVASLFARGVPCQNGCREWSGKYGANGYATVHVDGRYVTLHRLAWETKRGPIPSGHVVQHLCHNRKCHEITHLEATTQRRNIDRGMADGRVRRGERHGMARLSEADVRAIKMADTVRLGPTGRRPRGFFDAMGKRFGVSPGTIRNVCRQLTWSWLNVD